MPRIEYQVRSTTRSRHLTERLADRRAVIVEDISYGIELEGTSSDNTLVLRVKSIVVHLSVRWHHLLQSALKSLEHDHLEAVIVVCSGFFFLFQRQVWM